MRIRFVVGSLIALVAVAPSLGETPLSTAFTYHGQLKENGVPANGVYDVRFALYDVATGGAAISPTVCSEDLPVTDGLFTAVVPLTLPPSGAESYLEIQVRPGIEGMCASTTGFAILDPRQKITPAPIATFASAVTSNPPAIRGAIRLNSVNGQFEGFNGAFWVPFTTGDPITPGNTQDFTTPGTFDFVVPEGLFALGVDLWSGGGGGGGRSSTAAATSCDSIIGGGGAGGGGGGAFIRAVIDVFPGDVLRLTVGAGGAAGAPATNGANGGLSAGVRDSLAVVRAFQGRGGDRGTNNMAVTNDGIPPGCDSYSAGAGGTGGNPQTPLGILLYMQTGNTGNPGRGPSCYFETIPFPGHNVFCPAYGGNPGSSIQNPLPLAPFSAGIGGRGADAGGTGTAGQPGRIRLFLD